MRENNNLQDIEKLAKENRLLLIEINGKIPVLEISSREELIEVVSTLKTIHSSVLSLHVAIVDNWNVLINEYVMPIRNFIRDILNMFRTIYTDIDPYGKSKCIRVWNWSKGPIK